ncbi:MAG: hypothetical protein KBH07_01550, partial [Flavobacteriales bacterium]|nr:hypothetical protein [Flavobacteriales bacterium]
SDLGGSSADRIPSVLLGITARILPCGWRSLGAFCTLDPGGDLEATLFAALINLERRGSNIVYLTLLGGGAFGNPQVWIMDALRQALHRFKDVPLDVRIVSYGSPDPLVKAMADGW